jgi:hypothetical protein
VERYPQKNQGFSFVLGFGDGTREARTHESTYLRALGILRVKLKEVVDAREPWHAPEKLETRIPLSGRNFFLTPIVIGCRNFGQFVRSCIVGKCFLIARDLQKKHCKSPPGD